MTTPPLVEGESLGLLSLVLLLLQRSLHPPSSLRPQGDGRERQLPVVQLPCVCDHRFRGLGRRYDSARGHRDGHGRRQQRTGAATTRHLLLWHSHGMSGHCQNNTCHSF